MRAIASPLVHRSNIRLEADASRVIARLFVPGQEGFDQQESRAATVLDRLLVLDESEVERSLDDVMSRFASRHRDLTETFRRHADHLAGRLDPNRVLSSTRRLLLGATFTAEYAIEGAALCNPSMLVHPDQTEVAAGSVRFIMSARAIGEGHLSSIEFRTGVIDGHGVVTVESPSPFAAMGQLQPTLLDAAAFRTELRQLGSSGGNTDFVFDGLNDQFTSLELEERLGHLHAEVAIRHQADRTISLIRRIASRTYGVTFATETALSERVLWPASPAESNGMEDARFVRFVEDDGRVRYLATYTAYDGRNISQQLLETTDFRAFTSSPIVGPGAANKGLALFPRRISGRFAALSRWDRETNAVAFSDNPLVWRHASSCQVPIQTWELLQLGNCGPPIETGAGWLVLTHGVGPMRTYSIGAILLDLEDPTKILGQLSEPLLTPQGDERDGYVPNVVYSCGGIVHADTLVLPYGIGDAAISVATVPLGPLLDALRR
jgi:predicted GH43/DUF377 family glycosyl hydrolase